VTNLASSFLAVTVFSTALILVHFHDRSWLPRDDGYYAHIADRLLHGEVLHRDVQALHAGYVYFASALALWLFGDDLVSLRYPLVALGSVQSGLLFMLFLPRGPLMATAAALGLSALSFVQFPNPTANWYCLFLLVTILAALRWMPPPSPWRLPVVGFLLGLTLLFRQLTGVIVAIGVLSYLLIEHSAEEGGGRRWLARVVLAIMLVGLIAYVARSDPLAILLFGFWPAVVLAWAWWRVAIGNGEVLRLLMRLAPGAAMAVGPLLGYHLLTGSLAAWLRDAVVSATALSQFDYVKTPRYGMYITAGVGQMIQFSSLARALNGLFWITVTALPAALGVLVLRRLSAAPTGLLHPLPFIAVFYGVVALHYQDPAYLFFVDGVALAGFMWLVSDRGRWRRYAAVGLAGGLAGIALYYQAGQPLSRGYESLLAGERVPLVASDLERAHLTIERRDVDSYRRILRLIEREVPVGAPIFGVPAQPELYFLSRRKNPLPFTYLSFGILSEAQLRETITTLEREPPRLVFFVPRLPYNTAYTARIMDHVRRDYDLIDVLGDFEIYRHRGPGPLGR
jgi:hypothetical protein